MRYKLLIVTSVTMTAASIAFANVAWSAAWSGNSGVRVGISTVRTSIDNASDAERASSFTVGPFYQFNRASRAQSIQGRLGVEHRRFSDDGGQSTSPSLALDSRTTLIDRGVWLNVQADASSRRISNTGFTDDTPTRDNETTTTMQLQFGPEFRYQPSGNMIIDAKAAASRILFGGDGSNEIDQDSTSIGLGGSILWALGRQGYLIVLDSRYQQTEFDNGSEASLASLAIGGVKRINSRLATYALLGYDQITVDDVDEGTQELYALGVRWRPDRRVELNAEYAQRAFGRQPTVSMLLKGRRSQLEFRWSRDLQIRQFVDTDIGRLQLPQGDGEQDLNDQSSNGLDPVQTCTIPGDLGCVQSALVLDAETVQEAIAAIYTLRGRASSVSVSLTRTELEDLDGANNRSRNDATISVSRSLARNLSLTVSGSLSETQASITTDSQTIQASMVWLSR